MSTSTCECKDDTPLWTNIIAYIGGAILGFAPWQQLWKAFKTKKTKDISLKACLYIIIGLCMSITFTSYNKIFPILIPTSIELLAWVMLLIFKICFSNDNIDTVKDLENSLSDHANESVNSLTAFKGSIKTSHSLEHHIDVDEVYSVESVNNRNMNGTEI
uniref:PQ-loop repeat-containing protein n=1 Tax=viral metagenome TaxID=1070528 RepID=A0A6C0EAH2_9ZZZZ